MVREVPTANNSGARSWATRKAAQMIKRTRQQVASRKAKRKAHAEANRRLSENGGTVGIREALPPHKWLEETLDGVFSLFIRLRAKYRTGGNCEICGGRPVEVCFHWITRSRKGIRWHPLNAVGSCSGCNFNERQGRSTVNDKYQEIFVSRYGTEDWEWLKELQQIHPKWSRDEMAALLKRIKAALAGEPDNDYVLRESATMLRTRGPIDHSGEGCVPAAQDRIEHQEEWGDRQHTDGRMPGASSEVLCRELEPDAPVLRGDAGPSGKGAVYGTSASRGEPFGEGDTGGRK